MRASPGPQKSSVWLPGPLLRAEGLPFFAWPGPAQLKTLPREAPPPLLQDSDPHSLPRSRRVQGLSCPRGQCWSCGLPALLQSGWFLGLRVLGTCLAKPVCRRMGVGLGARKARVRILSQPLISRGTWGEFLYSPELSFPSRGKMAITPEGQRPGLCSFYLNSQYLACSEC